MDELESDRAFYDQSEGGVSFSGGEPLAQPSFLEGLLRASKHSGFHTALDTCGFSTWEMMDSVRKMVDLFLYDLKFMDDIRHRQFTGTSNVPILRNLRRLSQLGHRIVLRVPVIPGINDDEENVHQIGRLATSLPSLERIDLLSYHRIGRDKYKRLGKTCPMPDTVPLRESELDVVIQALCEQGLSVKVEGRSGSSSSAGDEGQTISKPWRLS
jgi:pyruvate formate lyase activating enzyme